MGLVAMNEVAFWTEMKRAADFGQVKLPGEGENNYDPLNSKLNLLEGGAKQSKY